jgi:hypothetical protein
MLDIAYQIGRRSAIEEFDKVASSGMEKEAFLSALKAVYDGSKLLRSGAWMLGMGGRGSQFIGMPIGSGLISAAFADEGERTRAFFGGAAGGLAGAGLGHLGAKVMTGAANRAGKYLASKPFGQKMWSGAGNVGQGYGAKSLAEHTAKVQKDMAKFTSNPANAGKVFKPTDPPNININDSFGQHIIRKLPGTAGFAGGIAGFIYGTQPGETVGTHLYDQYGPSKGINFGYFGQRSAFNPARF